MLCWRVTFVAAAAFFMALVGTAAAAPGDVTTTRVTNHVPEESASGPNHLVRVGDVLFFTASSEDVGRELWTIAPPYETATLVEDSVPGGGIAPGTDSPSISSVFAIGDVVFFAANDGTNGSELWKTTPPYETAAMVPDGGINPGAGSSGPGGFAEVNGTLFFAATDDTNGRELWKSDPPYGSVSMIEDETPGGGINDAGDAIPFNLAKAGNDLFFVAQDDTNDFELWRYDGTIATMVEDDTPGGGINEGGPSFPEDLTDVNGTLYLTAEDGVNGREVWRAVGNAATMVEGPNGINPTGAADAGNFTPVGDKLLLRAYDGTDSEVWLVDGTAATMVEDINPTGSSFPGGFTKVGDAVYFRARNPDDGEELWRTGPPYASATMVDAVGSTGGINPGSADASPSNFAVFGGSLLMSARSAAAGTELWRVAGTTAALVEGATPGTGLAPGTSGSSPEQITPAGDRAFLRAGDTVNGNELWVTDGLTGSLVGEGINPGSESSWIRYMTAIGDRVFFVAEDGTTGPQIWRAEVEGPPAGGLPEGGAPATPAPPADAGTPKPKRKCTRPGTGKKKKAGKKRSSAAPKKKCKKKKRKGRKKK